MIRSYFIKYRAKSGCMVGGVVEAQSCRFQRKQDAQSRLNTILEFNGDNVVCEIVPSVEHPEIFVHCGTIPTAIGCRCPGCGVILDVIDARKAEVSE